MRGRYFANIKSWGKDIGYVMGLLRAPKLESWHNGS